MKRTLFVSGLLALALAFSSVAQNRVRFAGEYAAIDFAYGLTPGVAGPLQVYTANGATTGTSTVTIVTPVVTLGDGTTLYPVTTNTPITIDTGTNQETVTPSTVSGCNYNSGYGGCSISASFTHIHGIGTPITTGTAGLQEALNYAQGQGGGKVAVDNRWSLYGGTNALITAAAPYSSVFIEDNRGGSGTLALPTVAVAPYWTAQPSTLTSLAVPSTLTSTTMTWSGTGTWSGTYHVCVTYVDMLGGEGPCSADYSSASGTNFALNITSPAASTGAVGYRVYGSTTYATAYLLATTSTNCTLTNLEQVMPACAIGSNAVFPTLYLSTTALRPNPHTSLSVNTSQPLPQGHTTFAYAPTATVPVNFQTNYGPFPALGALTSGQIATLGTINLPQGYLNVIGRTVRVTGKIALTTLNTAALPYITLGLTWAGGVTAGAPIAACSIVPAAAGSTATANEFFSCTMTTNAVGATAVGTVMTNGWEMLFPAAGGALTGAGGDTGTAAIGSLGLFAQAQLNVIYTSTTNSTGGEQLLDLHFETLQ